MGNVLSVCHAGDKQCHKCQKKLPWCCCYNNIKKDTIHGRSVYVFNGGEYYRSAGGDRSYECEACFNKKDSITEIYHQIDEQYEDQVDSNFTKIILKRHLNEFQATYELDSDCDELLEILSVKCRIPVENLSLPLLRAHQLEQVLSVLDKLLFDEWISAPPSLSTLQHTQVFITELCALSLETPEGLSLQTVSNHVQSLVVSISQTACDAFQSFMLTQALYLNFMHFFTEQGSSDNDAVLIAKQWAEDELSTVNLFLIDFLGTLTSSLQNAVGKASVFVVEVEIQCLKLLLHKLTHLNAKETHSDSTEMLLSLVHTNQWTPPEVLTLLKALSLKNMDDVTLMKVLTLVQAYTISPEWTDESGHSLVQIIDNADPETFHQDFQRTLRRKDKSSLDAALVEIKTFWNLDDSQIDMIKNVTSGVLQYSENIPKDAAFMKDSFKGVTLSADQMKSCLCQLCKAVFDTKGWWPTVEHMLRWCALVLTEKSEVLQLVGMEEDPCVTAMFAATQVCMGNKLDIVLSSDAPSQHRTMEWSDFYKNLNVSLNTNMKKNTASNGDVYEADIVYGTMDDFVFDYFQHSKMMETRNPLPCRGFIIEEQSVNTFYDLELSQLKENHSPVHAAEVLQRLMGKFQSEDTEQRRSFIKALFQVLHSIQTNDTATDTKLNAISQKLTGKGFSSDEAFILTFLENLLRVVTGKTDTEINKTGPAAIWCSEILFDCAEQFLPRNSHIKVLLQMVSNLIELNLWSPVEVLNLLGALTDHHHNEGCISIKKILHLLATYQVSSKWTDENNQTLLTLLDSNKTENLIKHLKKALRDEKIKSIDFLIDEIRQMKDIDETTLSKTQSVVTHVEELIKTGEIENHTNIQRARNLSHSKDIKHLQEVLAVLCNAVNLHRAEGEWWPRNTQMISWCLLALSDTGKLLEMGTGEGKSCVIAMFAVLRVLRGEKVDVVSSSSVLCQRDAEEWAEFYKYFGITVDTNTNQNNDEDRKKCYQKDVIYGTIEDFAADHLRQIFEMKDVRPDREYQCIIIDEVDSLLLDQGVQMTYLSSPMVSMQHLNSILAIIWSQVSQYGFLPTGNKTFVQSPPASFFKAIFDSMYTEETEIDDPIDILQIAEETNIVPKGFTEDIHKSEKDELLKKLKTVSRDDMVRFFKEIEDYVPYGFTVYTLDDKGSLSLQKSSPYDNRNIPELTFLVLEGGMCCSLYESEEILIKPIAESISKKIQYTPCTNEKGKISIPGFLKNLIDKKLPVWVENAFLAMLLKEGREYDIKNGDVCPVDYRSTGIVEQNKKWGDGLQQFVEIKHQIKLSTISAVTNYISNLSFFEKYQGKIYGTTGTLGSKKDIEFLQDLYPNLSTCKMPTFNRKKLFEVKGTLTNSDEEWKSEIKRVVKAQISPNSYRSKGRAALVICETINKAKEIHAELKSCVPGEIILYCRGEKENLNKIDKKLHPGDVIVATNLAGRGTDIKVSNKVNKKGGLFVILSFLSENTRVELQAFGRTARKGKPGSAQVIMCTKHLQQSFRTVSTLDEAKNIRDKLAAEKVSEMKNDVAEMKLREFLFSEYCKTLRKIYNNTDGDDRRVVVAIMNEFWGMWLQTKAEEITQLKTHELQKSLTSDLALATRQTQEQTSPCASIYHYIKFGNVARSEKKWDVSTKMFEKAMKLDENWAAIAFYNHAYCTIKQKKENYFDKARGDLMKAQESLKYLTEECIVCLFFTKMSSADSDNSDTISLEKQLTSKWDMLGYLDKNITEAIQKLDEIQNQGRNAIAIKSQVFSLVSSADENLKVEAYNLYNQGLKYVFSVEEKPHFQWEALLVFFLGSIQIVAATLLIAYTGGVLAQMGMGLISAGIKDIMCCINSMLTGEFSWKSWAIEKASSLVGLLFSTGMKKLTETGIKPSKALVERLGKKLKALPQILSKQAENQLSVVSKTNLKNAVRCTAKKVREELMKYELGEADKKILEQIVQSIKTEVKKGITDEVKSNMEKKELTTLVDSIILSQLRYKGQLRDVLDDMDTKNKLLFIFKTGGNSAIEPFYKDPISKLNSAFTEVMNKVKAEAKGTVHAVLTAVQTVHMEALTADAITSVVSLSEDFFSNLTEEIKKWSSPQEVKEDELSDSDMKLLNEFKEELTDTISALLANASVDIFNQKFSSHLVSYAQNKVNEVIRKYVKVTLKTHRTEERLRAGQHNIAYVPGEPISKHKTAVQSHAENIKKPMTTGTLLDVRVLSETTGTKVVILTQDKHGRLTKMEELSPSSKPASQTVTLIYRPKSDQYPDGHYDVQINDRTVTIDNKGKSCLFHALAQGMKPEASDDEISLEAARLRTLEADTLLNHPGQWEPFIKRKEWTEAIRGGDWYMEEGAAPKRIIKENKKLLKKEVGKLQLYKEWKKYKPFSNLDKIINADLQPPINSILEARNLNQNSRFPEAMLEEIKDVNKYHGRELPAVYVPKNVHYEFPSTKSKAFRTFLATTISNDDVVGTFKQTILGAMVRFKLINTTNFNNFTSTPKSKTRLAVFEESFQQHSEKMVNSWFNLLQCKGVMTNNDLNAITTWIQNKGYNDQSDLHRNQVINLL